MKFIKKIIPDYSIFPLAAMLALNYLAYFGTRLFTEGMTHYDISTPLDRRIPYVSVFIVPYLLAFLQWIIGYICIGRQSKEYCYRVMYGEMISKVLVGIIFVAFPTIMVREAVTGNGLLDKVVAGLYSLDAPTNLFPSVHCLESYICMKFAIETKGLNRGFKIAMICMSILVFLSTLFVRQHVILDFFGAVAVAEMGRRASEYIFAKRERIPEKNRNMV